MNIAQWTALQRGQKMLLVALALVALFLVTALLGVRTGSHGTGLAMLDSVETASYGAPSIARDVSVRMQKSFDGGMVGSAEMVAPPDVFPMPTAPESTAMIVRSASLSLLVEDVERAVSAIDAIRIRAQGQVGSTNVSNTKTSRYGSVTLWVPSERLDGVLEEIRAVGIRVTNFSVNAHDVSAEYVDNEARLKNLRATEAQYIEIMKRSGTIPEVLQVTSALSSTREGIEQLEAHMKYLSRQVALSSITVDLSEEVTPALTSSEWRPLSVIRNAARETLRELTTFVDDILELLVALPVMLLKLAFYGTIIYALFLALRVVYRRISPSPSPAPKP